VSRPPHFLTPLLRGTGATLRRRGGPVVAHTVETAFDSSSRRRGLLGRAALADQTALILAPASAVHTFGMAFPIDVVFVARDGRVLKVRASMPPYQIAMAWWAFAVVELPAGTLERAGVRAGDHIEIAATSPPP